jgi:hypothetical protein
VGTLYATLYHRQATVAGTSSVWRASSAYLQDWLTQHPHAFQNPDFVPLLCFYRVGLIVLQMGGGYDEQVFEEEAVHNPEHSLVGCFPAPAEPGPWDYPICILRVLPERTPDFNLLLREGWSGAETWGRWIEGTEARAEWVATSKEAQLLASRLTAVHTEHPSERFFGRDRRDDRDASVERVRSLGC